MAFVIRITLSIELTTGVLMIVLKRCVLEVLDLVKGDGASSTKWNVRWSPREVCVAAMREIPLIELDRTVDQVLGVHIVLVM